MRENGFEVIESRFRLGMKKKIFRDGEKLEEVTRRCGCPHPESVLGQTGWGCEQSGLVGCGPTSAEELDSEDLEGPFQARPF